MKKQVIKFELTTPEVAAFKWLIVQSHRRESKADLQDGDRLKMLETIIENLKIKL